VGARAEGDKVGNPEWQMRAHTTNTRRPTGGAS
jgi:hypothetical protein